LSPEPAGDPHVERLARLFREHPAWREAARHLSEEATSRVIFSHRPGERWRLERRGEGSLLLPGDAPDPDLVFRFSPAAIARLAGAEGSVGDFALELFGLIVAGDAEARVDLRIAAPFARLARRGYVRLLVAAGWRVLAFGARHGVRSLSELRRLVERIAARTPAPWEGDGGGDSHDALRPPAG
jgi:hypothetical protein